MPGLLDRFKKKQVRGIPARARGTKVREENRPFTKTKVSGVEFRQWAGNKTRELLLTEEVMTDRSRAYKFFFQTVCRYYPMAAAAVWTWKNLCATRQKVKFVGGQDRERSAAQLVIAQLDKRIAPFKYVQGGGMDLLLSQFFHYLFTYGRFAGDMQLSRDQKTVERFVIRDPFWVRFTKKDRRAYVSDNGIDYYKANENTFFYYALDMDWENPAGVAMIESVWSLMKMAENMLDDMARSSSNAGVPRLHIKIQQPEQMENENDESYVNRVNTYFDAYVSNFSDIAPDDNFYSWDDISIGIVGGQPGATGFVWRLNRQIFDEEIIAGYHLFPWIVGKSSQTTKNWVRSQFDLIMSQTETIQKIGKRFSEWIRQTELSLKGITNVRVHQEFQPVRDPARKDMAIAGRFEIANVEAKVRDGFISPDDGARELNYDKAFDAKVFPYSGKTEGWGANSNGENNETVSEGIEEIKEMIDTLTHTVEEGNNERDNSNTVGSRLGNGSDSGTGSAA